MQSAAAQVFDQQLFLDIYPRGRKAGGPGDFVSLYVHAEFTK